ncbi:hypothetical protein T281_16040 [Rhodomicrobium udaipurense JA643]|uniref:VWA domain-containing protein n=1 Tax=Rhodomicrobium udaipurense TaxID=1202716 RepID=A0A8I1GA15_9HYPH|nr:vWA domain-containing protein [Rhodomicrobium udaipurense]KAI93540.1 hypothetical protein T281_16040 [Rhodomicrobium udaipurense JA643]MBJ7543287.1 VWA domain-containing protein [Rhodomicrobium udaipurense]
MSKNLPTTPLGRILAGAKKSLPAETGATARIDARFAGASGAVVILADVSGSMAESAGVRRRIEVLREALTPLPAGARLVAFSATAREVSEVPEPEGGTALHAALEYAARYSPSKTIVVSDGQPDDKTAALEAARRLTGIVDVIYCGPDSDREAIEFMRSLAKIGLGNVVVRPLTGGAPALASTVRQLALPPK